MDEKKVKVRKPQFSEAENNLMAAMYRDNLDLLRSTDTKADINRRKREKYQEIADSVNSMGSAIVRTGNHVKERIMNMIKTVKDLPQAKKPPTGGGPAPPPLEKEWQKILLEIVRENPATEGLPGGIEYGDDPERIKEALESTTKDSSADESDTGSQYKASNLPEPSGSRPQSSLSAGSPFPRFSPAAVDSPTPSSVTTKGQKRKKVPTEEKEKTLEEAQMELIELEKEKVKLKIEELKDRRKVHAAALEYYQLKNTLLQNQAAEQQPNVGVEYMYGDGGFLE